MAIRVLTVDDSILFRTVIKNEFAKIDDIDIIDTAANAAEAEEKIMRLKPDVVTMDVEMPGMNGFETCAVIRKTQNLPQMQRTDFQ